MSTTKELHIWADSFHEGLWAINFIGQRFEKSRISYQRGFIPVLEVKCRDHNLKIRVFGDYRAWSPLPKAIESILQFGKPDFMIYCPTEKRVLFVVEETAAVPTGNQALQRCERVLGSCLQKTPVPFAYLLPEYGLHLDDNARRASVWPFILAAKLTDQYSCPSLVLTYGDKVSLEDYSVGSGLEILFDLITTYIKEYLGLHKKYWLDERELLVKKAQQIMGEFIRDHGSNMLKVIPNSIISDDKVSLDWPLVADVGNPEAFEIGEQLRKDTFLLAIGNKVKEKAAYTLVKGAGSKPQPIKTLKLYEKAHSSLVIKHPFKPKGYEGYKVKLDEFPKSDKGNLHLTSSTDITFLFDNCEDIISAFQETFSRPKEVIERLKDILTDLPGFLYTSASMSPGRVFGDPYTGQLSCFSKIFAYDHNNNKTRKIIAYFPLQSYGIFPKNQGDWTTSKGLRIYTQLVDIIICQGGVIILPPSREII